MAGVRGVRGRTVRGVEVVVVVVVVAGPLRGAAGVAVGRKNTQ